MAFRFVLCLRVSCFSAKAFFPGSFRWRCLVFVSIIRRESGCWLSFLPFAAALLSLAANAQKKPFDASTLVSADLLNGPSATRHGQLKPVVLDKALFGAVAAKADVDTGQVRRMEGKINLPKADTERQSVDTFLKSNAEIFGATAKNEELKLLREVKSPAGDHFYYQQLYQGFPLWGGRISVHNVVGSKA